MNHKQQKNPKYWPPMIKVFPQKQWLTEFIEKVFAQYKKLLNKVS